MSGRWNDGDFATPANLNHRANAPVYNVKDYGAVADAASDGSSGTDNESAFNDAITDAIDNDGIVYIPEGRYGLSTQLTFGDVVGLKIVGSGKSLHGQGTDSQSTIVPLDALSANTPPIKVQDARECVFEGWRIKGNSSVDPDFLLEFEHTDGGNVTLSHNTLRNMMLGTPGGSFRDGVGITSSQSTPTNGEQFEFDSVVIRGHTRAAYNFTYQSALGHMIRGGQIISSESGSAAFRTTGAGFTVSETFLNVAGIHLDLQDNNDYKHPIRFIGVQAEDDADIISASSSVGTNTAARVYFIGYYKQGGTANNTIIDWQAAGESRIGFFQCDLNIGETTTSKFTDAESKVLFVGGEIGLSDITYNGDLLWLGVGERSTPTWTNSGSGNRVELFTEGEPRTIRSPDGNLNFRGSNSFDLTSSENLAIGDWTSQERSGGDFQISKGGSGIAEFRLSSGVGPFIPNFTDSGRPSAGTSGQVIYNTDADTLQFDDGSNWQSVATI